MKLIQYIPLNVLQTEILVPNPWRIDVGLDLLEKSAGKKILFLITITDRFMFRARLLSVAEGIFSLNSPTE